MKYLRDEPLASYSNAAFPVAGAVAYIQYTTWLGLVFLFVTIYMGGTSFGFHKARHVDRKKKWQRLDEGAMYISMWFLFTAFLMAGVVPPWLILTVGLAIGTFMAINYHRFDSTQTIFCLFTALAVLALYFVGNSVLWPVGTFALAFAVRQTGEALNNRWKDLTHAIWHALCAYGFYQFFELAHMVVNNAFR